jgi:1,4-dihydroxy-2-naphthoate octaprenyltransferase
VLPLLFLVIGTAAGLSYDLWLRQSRWSWVCYVVAFVVLPPFVWSALDIFHDELLAGYAIALPLAPAAHIANVLPDRVSDAASGRRNLTVIWGRSLSLEVLAACLLAPVLLTALSLVFIDYDQTTLWIAMSAHGLLLLAAATSYLREQDQVAFRFVAVASVIFVGGWLAAV